MSDAALAVPLSRLFVRPAPPPAGPSPAERQRAAVAAAHAEGVAEAESRLLPRIAELEAELARLATDHGARLRAEAARTAALLSALEGAMAEAVTSLGLSAARTVLGREPRLDAETLGLLVVDALAGLPDGAAGLVRMHPDDLASAPALPAGWACAADPALAPGRVVAERGSALSAAGLEARLSQLAEQMEQPE